MLIELTKYLKFFNFHETKKIKGYQETAWLPWKERNHSGNLRSLKKYDLWGDRNVRGEMKAPGFPSGGGTPSKRNRSRGEGEHVLVGTVERTQTSEYRPGLKPGL